MHIKRRTGAVFSAILSLCAFFSAGASENFLLAAASSLCGTYTVSVSNDMPMGKNNISDLAVLEAWGGNYYLSLAFNTAKLSDIRLEIGGKTAGRQILGKNGDMATYCYTLSEESIAAPLPFVADVLPMGQSGLNREINVTVDLSSAEKTSDTIENRGERPAEFVPTLLTNAGSEYLQETGTAFTVPSATAVLGSESCNVAISTYYVNGDELQSVASENNRLSLDKKGEYRIVYRASSPLYKTSDGNDTYMEYIVKIFSGVGVSPLAKFEDINGILPEGVTLQASRIEAGALYNTAAERMKTVSDHYEVFDVNLYDAEGKAIDLSDTVRIGISESSEYVGEEIEIYYLSESGMLGKLTCTELNGYVEFETDRLGAFIVCIPGVAFVMPMWGYAVILVACVLVVAAAVTVTVVLVRRKKKANKSTEA